MTIVGVKLPSTGGPLKATAAQALDPTNNATYMTPQRVWEVVEDAGLVSVSAYGAVGDDSTDNSAAFTAALATGKPVFVPAGIYRVSSAIAITASKTGLIGMGREASEIKIVSTTAKAITIANGLTRVILKGIRVTREGVPVAGADGIDCSTAILGTSTFEDIACEGHWDGVSLGVTDYSYLNNVLTKKNYRDGIRMTNVGTNGQLQWNLHQCLSQLNDGNGYHVLVDGSAGQVTLGNWDSCSTYANTGNGVRAVGSASMPVQGLRLNNCYVGEDNGGAGVYLDTHGTFHRIIGCFIELCGRVATGRTASTAATNTGPGIDATANNNALTIVDTRIDSCSYDGIQTGARHTTVTGCDITDNGLALMAGRRSGINQIAGCSVLAYTGGMNGHRGVGTSQQYGVSFATGSTGRIVGVAFVNPAANFTLQTAGGPPSIVGCWPTAANVACSNSGTSSIASGTTSVAVTHGLAATPAATLIRVAFTENPTNDPGNWWLSAIGATTFTVNVRADPGASNLDFSWSASLFP